MGAALQHICQERADALILRRRAIRCHTQGLRLKHLVACQQGVYPRMDLHTHIKVTA